METKGVTCKIPLALHNRITEEIRQNESTMSKFIEQIILEHYTKGATTMGKTRTLAFQVRFITAGSARRNSSSA